VFVCLHYYCGLHISKYDSRRPASVATSPTFPGRSIEHTNGLDLANPMFFAKKNRCSNGKSTRSPLARVDPGLAGRPRSCSATAPGGAAAAAPPRRLPGICSLPWPRAGTVMAVGQEGGRRTRQIGPPRSSRSVHDLSTLKIFPAIRFEHTNDLDLANPMFFCKKTVLLMENQPAVL